MLLSDRFQGFFVVPEGGLGWNYNFQGVKHNTSMDYSLKVDSPEPYYAECHRPQHFLSFVQMEEGEDAEDVIWSQRHLIMTTKKKGLCIPQIHLQQ